MNTHPKPSDLAPLALLYHENSKISPSNMHELAESVAEFSSDPDTLRGSITNPKTYPGPDRIPLLPRSKLPIPGEPLAKTLSRRRSARSHGNGPVAFHAVASMLDHACGVTGSIHLPEEIGFDQPLRANPSGGALYPVEIYCVAFQIAGLEPGIYHHHPVDRCLEVVRKPAALKDFESLVLTPDSRLECAGLIILAGRFMVTMSKYRERGYRVMLLDAGHAAQNLLLTATALGIAACPIAGFLDDALGDQLGLDRAHETPLYAISFGLPPG